MSQYSSVGNNKGFFRVSIALMAILFSILISCSSQKKILTKAAKFTEQGNYDEAANLYYNILLQDAENKEAKNGLQAIVQIILNEKFAKFSKFVIEGNIEDALQTYHYAKGYTQNAEKVGVSAKWPDEYDEVFADVLKEYTDKQFDLAVNLMTNKKYEAAEKVFERIARFDSSFKDVSVLRLNTVLEPIYKQAIAAFNQKEFKNAYFLFSKIVSLDNTYKDAANFQKLSLQQATVIIGVLPAGGENVAKFNFENLSNVIADGLAQQEGAYIKIADAVSLKKELSNRGFSAFTNSQQAIEAASNTNLTYAIIPWVDSLNYNKTAPTNVQMEAYEEVIERILNPYTNTYSSISRFKKVSYTDKSETQQITGRLNLVLYHVKNKVILKTETIPFAKTDELHIASYNGNSANLYPALPDENFTPHVSQEWRNRFVNPRKNLLPFADFVKQLQLELAAKSALILKKDFQ